MQQSMVQRREKETEDRSGMLEDELEQMEESLLDEI